MNLILEKTDQVPYFTNMRVVFDALRVDCEDFDWYVSDLETNITVPELGEGGRWFSGRELKRLITEKSIQFIWGVFCAVESGKRLEIDTEPYANGNPDFWKPDGSAVQLNGALFEIVCWDSSATLLIGIPETAGEAFCKAYPDAKRIEDVAR
jgi:hypothetical protein